MRKIFAIAANILVRMGRDRKALVIFLLMPMILIGILGVSLKDLMVMGKLEPFTVIVVNEDQEARPPLPPGAPPEAVAHLPVVHLGKQLVDEVLLSDEVKSLLKLSVESDAAAARERVNAGAVAALIHIPADYSTLVTAGKAAQIGLYTDPGRATQAEIVGQVVRAYTDQVTASTVAAALAGPAAPQVKIPVPKVIRSQSGTRDVSAMQYYAAAMAVMYMMMSALQRAKSILLDRENGTFSRILVSPTPRWNLLAGQTLGSAVLIATQFLILVAGTRLIYGVYWGHLGAVLLLGGAFALAAAGIASGAAALLKDPKAADGAVGLVGMLFAALSGGMFPLYIFPEPLLAVARLIPNYWGLKGLLDQMAGIGFTYALTPALILIAIGLATGVLGSWRLASR